LKRYFKTPHPNLWHLLSSILDIWKKKKPKIRKRYYSGSLNRKNPYYAQSAATIRHLFSEINQRSPFSYVEALAFQSADSGSMRKKLTKLLGLKQLVQQLILPMIKSDFFSPAFLLMIVSYFQCCSLFKKCKYKKLKYVHLHIHS
jgi:hypothetical protein